MKKLYIEEIPRKHNKVFEEPKEAYKYYEKRFNKFWSWKPNTCTFKAKIITLNKDGRPRKQTECRRLTKKQKENYKKAMEKRKEALKQLAILKGQIENKLKKVLNGWGYSGEINIKYFNICKEEFKTKWLQ